ncbi:MAG TPA: hypothetical protein VM286_03315 [Candidatus Thermoplasmatota archaeon]|nr:hypothetical protein [Candidatus Thermoplasmatota archaeon]
MRIQAVMAALALLAVAGAGCSGPEATPHSPEVLAASKGGLQVPSLKVGDWWNFTTPGGASTWVVAGETGEDYLMETDSPGLAYFNTQSDISTLGQIRKSDLAGSQGKDRVEYFQWPLMDGKDWTTTWDGAKVSIRAKMETPEKYSFVAKRENGTLYATYTYDNRTHWFGELDFKSPSGESGFVQKLQASGTAYAGTLAHWDLKVVVDAHSTLQSPSTSTYDVPLTATDVYVDTELHCTAGFAGAGTAPSPFVGNLVGSDDRGAGNPGAQCPLDESFHGVAGTVRPGPNGGPETWGYDIVGGPGTTGSADLKITLRTLHRDPMK